LQAEDGIRHFHVTGVQTCALPISLGYSRTPKKFQPITPKSKITKLKTVARTGRRMLMEDKLILSLNFDMPYQFSFSPSFLHESRSEERRVGQEYRTRPGQKPKHRK